MRLKIFFFPVMIVISIIVVVAYIWPDISKIKDVSKIAIAKNQELKEIDAKKSAIDSIENKFTSNDSNKIAKDYLPDSKMEERVVSSINFLADSASVSLIDVSIENPEATVMASASPASMSAGFEVERKTANMMGGNQNPSLSGAKKAVSVKISVGGEYDRIKLFLDGLQHIPILNVVTALDISKQKEEKVDDVIVSTKNLLAVISVDFIYLPVTGVGIADAQNIETSDLNDGTVEILKKYISQNSQSLDMGNIEKGKENPFIAN